MKDEKPKPKYRNEAHQQNSEKAIARIAKSKNSKIDWEKELERLKRNSID